MDTIAPTRAVAAKGSGLILALDVVCRASLLFGLALLVVSWAGIIYRSSNVPSASIYVWSGGVHAYAFSREAVFGRASELDRRLYPSDSMHNPSASQLKLQQGTTVFGPHEDISKNGDGRYSDWDGTIVFSMPDNTDPRLGSSIRVTETASLSWLIIPFLTFGLIILIFRTFLPSPQPMAEVAFALRLLVAFARRLLAIAKSSFFGASWTYLWPSSLSLSRLDYLFGGGLGRSKELMPRYTFNRLDRFCTNTLFGRYLVSQTKRLRQLFFDCRDIRFFGCYDDLGRRELVLPCAARPDRHSNTNLAIDVPVFHGNLQT